MKLHCIGDSHTCFFMGYNVITSFYPAVTQSLFSNIYCYWLGPSLAYSVNKEKSSTDSFKKIMDITENLNPAEDALLFCLGEIDCRAHILYQAEQKGISVEEVINNTVSAYMETISMLIQKNFKVLVWNVVYSANFLDEGPNPEFPYFGTIAQRNAATTMFNNLLCDRAGKAGAFFININDQLFDTANNIAFEKYYYDMIHLNNRLFLTAVNRINGCFDGKLISKYQFALYYLKLALAVSGVYIANRKTQILTGLRKLYQKLKSKQPNLSV